MQFSFITNLFVLYPIIILDVLGEWRMKLILLYASMNSL